MPHFLERRKLHLVFFFVAFELLLFIFSPALKNSLRKSLKISMHFILALKVALRPKASKPESVKY